MRRSRPRPARAGHPSGPSFSCSVLAVVLAVVLAAVGVVVRARVSGLGKGGLARLGPAARPRGRRLGKGEPPRPRPAARPLELPPPLTGVTPGALRFVVAARHAWPPAVPRARGEVGERDGGVVRRGCHPGVTATSPGPAEPWWTGPHAYETGTAATLPSAASAHPVCKNRG